jgi:hypothetical protein
LTRRALFALTSTCVAGSIFFRRGSVRKNLQFASAIFERSQTMSNRIFCDKGGAYDENGSQTHNCFSEPN